MRKLLLIIVLLGAQLSTAEGQTTQQPTTKLTEQQLDQSAIEYSLWFNQLNEYLLSSENLHENAMGLISIIKGSLTKIEENPDNDQIKQLLLTQIELMNEIILDQNLSAKTSELLIGWCIKPQLAPYCDHNTLLDNHIKLAPDNLNSYLIPLHIANQQKNEPLKQQIIKLMAVTNFNHSMLSISQEFSQTLESYVKKHPIPESTIAAFKDDQALLSGIADEIKKDLDQKIREYFTTSLKMSYAYLYLDAKIQALYETCKTNISLFDECLQISQIIINKGNSINSKGLGYAMLMAMHENNNKKNLLNVVKEKHETYKNTVQCYSKASRSENVMNEFLDPEYQRINLQTINEFEKLKQLAEYVYQKYKESNPDLIDPATCE